MKESTTVKDLLLAFAQLPEHDRKLFIQGLNRYIFSSVVDRRSTRVEWNKAERRKAAERVSDFATLN